MSVLEYLFIGAAIVYALATLVWQFPHVRSRVTSDQFVTLMLPIWNFFAPTPGTRDFTVAIRTSQHDIAEGAWHKIDLSLPRASEFTWLLNPGARSRKALFDICTSMVQIAVEYEQRPEVIRLSLPYLVIANAVSAKAAREGAYFVQFAVIALTELGEGESDVLFVSDTLPVEYHATTPCQEAGRA